MEQNNFNQQALQAIAIGLKTIDTDDLKVSSKDIEDLAVFKSILRGILNGNYAIKSMNPPKELEEKNE